MFTALASYCVCCWCVFSDFIHFVSRFPSVRGFGNWRHSRSLVHSALRAKTQPSGLSSFYRTAGSATSTFYQPHIRSRRDGFSARFVNQCGSTSVS